MHTEFAWSLAQMIQYNSEYICQSNEFIHLTKAHLSYHSAARNQLVDTAQGDWLLMLDTDASFDPDLVARMLRVFDKYQLDVLTGLYHHKSPPHPPVIYKNSDNGEMFDLIGDWTKPEGEYLIPVGSAGAGCLMVRRSVFNKIKESGESPFDIIHPFGEDHSFFKRLQKIGIQGYCDPTIQTFHLRTQPIAFEDYDKEELILGPRQEVTLNGNS